MKLGYFGGSFDPVHRGHIQLARSVMNEAQLDQVVFMPAGQAPHKKESPRASAHHRLAMLRLALRGEEGMSIDARELQRSGPSYTVFSMQAIHEEHPEAELFFLIGQDSLAHLHQWYRVDELRHLVHFLVVGRPGHDIEAAAAQADDAGVHWTLVSMPPDEVSSSAVRRVIQEGGNWRKLLPTAVADYVTEHDLYT